MRENFKIQTTHHNLARAFTLVELSIVLVIIGLLTAGVVGGQSLVQSAKRQSAMTKIEGYKTAVNAFKLEYDAMPGDMSNAYDYWGSTCDATNTKCNGDGDGMAEDNYPAIDDNEASRFWQHLSLSGILSGNYTGNNTQSTIGVYPTSPIADGAGVNVHHITDSGVAMPSTFAGKHFFQLGAKITVHMNGPLLTPKDAAAIDKKYDDGLPDNGQIGVAQGSWVTTYIPNCKTGTEPNSTYRLTYTSAACHLVFAW